MYSKASTFVFVLSAAFTLCSILGMFYTLYSDNTVEYGDEYAGLALKLPWLTDPSRIGRHE